MYDMMYGYAGFGFFYMAVFWIAVIWLIIWIIKQSTKNNVSSHDILDKRLAKGEINKKEYLEMRKMLRK